MIVIIKKYIIISTVVLIRDDKLTGKFGYPSRPVWDGYGNIIFGYETGMSTFTKTRLGFGAGMGF